MLFDLKTLNSALDQLEEERGIPREKTLHAIEDALAAAYKKDYGKRHQFIRARFDIKTGDVEFEQVKIVVDESMLRPDDEPETSDVKDFSTSDVDGEPRKVKFNEEHHMMIDDARRIKKDAKVGDELVFPLEIKDEFGRIAAQTAKQVIIQKIREAEKVSVLEEYGKRTGEIISGHVQRMERGNVFVDLGRATGLLYRMEQIYGEHYRQGERIRALLVAVEETPRGINLRLSRAHPQFVAKLFEIESPEVASGTVEIKVIAREAGSRTKIAVYSHDDNIDAQGSVIGQHGIRVSTVISELGGEKIDIIEWSDLPEIFIANALSPGKVLSIELDEDNREAVVTVSDDQLSLVIGKGGQNVRLAAKLTGWKLDIITPSGSGRRDKPTEVPAETPSEPEIKE
ncbi:MAG TPA: transcription termination factor NusA [Candidatus Paceibacterota bacterium]